MRHRGHTIKFVCSEVLPDGTDWAFIEVDGQLVLLVKRDNWSPDLMAEAWTEYADLN